MGSAHFADLSPKIDPFARITRSEPITAKKHRRRDAPFLRLISRRTAMHRVAFERTYNVRQCASTMSSVSVRTRTFKTEANERRGEGRRGRGGGRGREGEGERRVTASSSALHYIMTQNGLILAAASRRQLGQHNRYALSLFRALIMAAPRKKTRNTEHYALRRDERE